ncbi:MAG: tripartite tricarboxylate transporter substrate binding protein [Burkholderiaceae bacterium]|nr:tripartite tricarboxylate transporter substrate binding protein [Burkholderiaceae bacterium]
MRNSHEEKSAKLGRREILTAALASALQPAFAAAPPWPQHPIKLVIAYPPGGGGDAAGRPLALALEKNLGVPVILDYRPGAGGTIAAQAVTNSKNDGTVIFLADNGAISVAPSYRSVGYMPRDFTYIGGIGELPLVLVTNPAIPANDIRELAQLSRSRSKGLSYASAGVGSIPHLAAELMKQEQRIVAEHIAYKGTGVAVTDLIAGVVDYALLAPSGVMQHVASGRLKALAITSRNRFSGMPQVPTVRELGFPSLQTAYISGLLAPRNLPAAVTARLSSAFQAVMADPEFKKTLESTGLLVEYRNGSQAQEVFENDLKKWRNLIVTAKLKLD